MRRDISYRHALRLARRVPESCRFDRPVLEGGRLATMLNLDLEALGIRPGTTGLVRVVPYYPGSLGENGAPAPYGLGPGRAAAIYVSVPTGEGLDTQLVHIDVDLPGLEGKVAELAVERVRTGRAYAAVACLACAAMAANLALSMWSDPAAKRGHYEGKTDEEIQADLDADVAWYAMEISVASAMTVPEGETTVEARIENPEANHCDQKVRILTAEGEELYASGALHPGEYLQTVELAHPLPLGTHTLTVEFQGYEQAPTLLSDEGKLLGHDTFGASCAAQVELTVVPLEA